MVERRFQREAVLEQLASLPRHQRAAYAVACADRLIPLYRWFQEVESWGDVIVLETCVEFAWNWVKGVPFEDAKLAAAVRECEAVIPDMDDFHSYLASRALDAGSAVAQALEACISPVPETAADAGEIAWECASGVEQSRISEASLVRIAEEIILMEAAQGPLVFLEADLQQRSLGFLRREPFINEAIDDFRNQFANLA